MIWKKLKTSTLLFLVASSTLATTWTHVYNQRLGTVELQFTRAWKDIGPYIRGSLFSENIERLRIKSEESLLLYTILDNLRLEKRNPLKALFFERNQEKFTRIKNACHKLSLAYTGNRPGTPIYLNQLAFYKTDNKRKVPNIHFRTIVQIIVHELGHHVGYQNHLWLNVLGNKVANYAMEYTKKQAELASKGILSSEAIKGNPFLKKDIKNAAENKFKKTKLTGLILVHSTDLEDDKKTLVYFVPTGTEEVYEVVPAPGEAKRINRFVKSSNSEGGLTPFNAAIDVTSRGKVITSKENNLKVQPTAPEKANALEIVNVWRIGKQNRASSHAIFGMVALDEKKRLYVHQWSYNKENKTADKWKVLLDFVYPEFKETLQEIVKEEGPTFALLYGLDPFNLKTGQPRVMKIATYLLDRNKD